MGSLWIVIIALGRMSLTRVSITSSKVLIIKGLIVFLNCMWCVCVCVHTHTRVCVYVWVYVWRPEINLVCHSLDAIHSPCFLRKALSLGFRARIPLLWLAGTTITNTHLYIWPFKWVPGFNLRASCLHDSHFTDRVSSSTLAPKCWCIRKSSMNPVRKNLVSQKFSFKQLFTTFSRTRA